MEKVSRYLETQTEPVSRNNIESNVSGKALYVRDALDTLVSEGYARETEGPRHGANISRLYTSLNTYREAEDTQPFVPSVGKEP
jgi:hypothetical protein